ncbi:MAG: carboxylesterase family protein [Solirubrobacterales bacterium]
MGLFEGINAKSVAANAVAGAGFVLFLALLLGAAPSGAAYTVQTGITYANESPAKPSLNQLDLYLPQSEPVGPGETDRRRPVVVWVHGGGWAIGDKSNRMPDKARLLTDAGYILASINYRLSPSAGGVPTFEPDRVMFPDHPKDVAAAIAWISDNIEGYGGDPDAMFLMGHSAGAHLVSLVGSDPSWMEDQGDSLRQILGVISLDAGAMDVVDSATQKRPQPTDNNYSIWNAFGNPSEEAVTPRWLDASPTTWGDPTDPRSLLITQAAQPFRIIDNQKMATALGQPLDDILLVPLDHEGINLALGDPTDTTGETEAVMAFISERINSRVDPKVSIRKRPAKVIKVGRKRSGKPKQRQVRFAFAATGVAEGTECRIDKLAFRPCSSPRKYWVGTGIHSFRVRALYPSGRPGAEKLVKFSVKAKPKKQKNKRR